MVKFCKKNKLYITIIILFLFCINSFAAIVSDNDGSAFITKSEFDALKNSFTKQIDNYNVSLDSKIDGAIASYLSGIALSSKIDLNLDEKIEYDFPLRYDNTEEWNNPDSYWYNLMTPQIFKKDVEITTYLGLQDHKANKGWFVNRSETGDGVILRSTISNVEDGYKWEIQQMEYVTLQYDGVVGTYAYVEKTGNTRTLNISGVSDVYNVYKCDSFGHGKQLVAYLGGFTEYVSTTSNDNLKQQSTSHPYTYYQMALCNGNIRNQTMAASGENWTRNNLISHQVGFRANKIAFTIGEKLSLAGIKNRYTTVNNPFVQDRVIVDESTAVASNANSFDDTKVQYIFGRGSVMPANLMGRWNLIPKINSSTSKVQYTVFIGAQHRIEKQFGWTWNPTPITYAGLVKAFPTFMPTLIANNNTEYDCSDTDDFSKLPSTLVTYEDSKGNTHYFDEGMFLGQYDRKGDVGFTVKFQKDAGSGTKVKLHISKKPFSYNFNNADLLEYKINNVSGKEQQLNYGTSYSVTIPAIEKNECLYMEWVPVTSGDLAALTSFDDYHMMVEN